MNFFLLLTLSILSLTEALNDTSPTTTTTATTTTLSCHQCSTITSPSCGDPFPSNIAATPCPTDRVYTLCRKIHQEVRDEVDVIRMCGYEEQENECYATNTLSGEYKTLVCQCKEDMCNTAVQGMESKVLLMLVVISLLFCA